jgi:cytochrome P450 family 4 subfamily V
MVYSVVIKPYFQVKFYLDQGVAGQFWPLTGGIAKQMMEAMKSSDVFGPQKRKVKENPNVEVRVNNLGTDAILTCSGPTFYREIFNNTQHYHKSKKFTSFLGQIVGKGLLSSEDEQWKKQRKVISALFVYGFLKDNVSHVRSTIRERIELLKRQLPTEFNAMDDFKTFTGEVVGKVFFHESLNTLTFEGKPLTLAFNLLLKDAMEMITSPSGAALMLMFPNKLPSHKRMAKRMEAFRAVIADIIEKRRKDLKEGKLTVESKGLLELLIEKQEEGGEDAISNIEIIDNFMTFFLAGMDTTAHLLSLTTYFLHENPEIKEELLQEIAQYYDKPNVTIEDIQKMEKTQHVLNETLRMVPGGPMMFMREAVDDHVLNGIKVKKGTLINIDLISQNHNPKYFEEPEKYNPSRWENHLQKSKGDGFAFIPFSAGPRNCIGQHLAQIETKIILSEFLLNFNFKLRDGYKFELGLKQLYGPKEDLKYQLTSRNEKRSE